MAYNVYDEIKNNRITSFYDNGVNVVKEKRPLTFSESVITSNNIEAATDTSEKDNQNVKKRHYGNNEEMTSVARNVTSQTMDDNLESTYVPMGKMSTIS